MYHRRDAELSCLCPCATPFERECAEPAVDASERFEGSKDRIAFSAGKNADERAGLAKPRGALRGCDQKLEELREGHRCEYGAPFLAQRVYRRTAAIRQSFPSIEYVECAPGKRRVAAQMFDDGSGKRAAAFINPVVTTRAGPRSLVRL